MKCILFLLLSCSTLILSAQSNSDTLTNQTIIRLVKAGLHKDIIKTKIQNTSCNFDVSTDALIDLKIAKVDDEIVNAMLIKMSSPKPSSSTSPSDIATLNSGIYYFDFDAKQYIELEPSVLTNSKSGGFGETAKRVLISGLINAKTKATLSNASAKTQLTQTKPTLIFVFDTTAQGLNNSTVLGTVQSPNEFLLVHLSVKNNTREIVVGNRNNVSANIGIDDKLKVAFSSKKLKRGVYEVTVDTPLDIGQYCFMFASSSMYQSGMKVYDFSIQ